MPLKPEGGGLGNLVEDITPQLGGDLDLNGNQITSPDGTDLIDIPNGSIDLQTNSVSRVDITDSGVRLGASGARVTTILDEDTMSSDSATALATQQSIKAYVDSASGGGGMTINYSNRYHMSHITAADTHSTAAIVADTLYLLPFFCYTTTTFTRIGVYVNSGLSSTNIRLGIYSVDSNDDPADLLLDAGTIDSSTSGTKEITISQSVPAGLHYLAFVSNGTPTLRVGTGGKGSQAAGMTTVTHSNGNIQYASKSFTYAALEDPTTGWTYTGGGNLTLFSVFLRKA